MMQKRECSNNNAEEMMQKKWRDCNDENVMMQK